MLVLSYVHFLRVEIPNGANVIAQFCWLNHYCKWNRHCYQVRSWRACKMPWKASKQPMECCGSIKKQAPAFLLSWLWGEGMLGSGMLGSGITGRQQVPKYHAKNHGRRDGHALRPEAGVTSPAHPWRKRLGDCRCKCKQIQAVNRTLFTVDYYYKNRCT